MTHKREIRAYNYKKNQQITKKDSKKKRDKRITNQTEKNEQNGNSDSLSIVILKVKGLNSPTKSQRVAE